MTEKQQVLTIAAGEFKAKCLGLLDQVLNENLKVIVTKRGKVMAEITQPQGEEKPFRSIFGRSSGVRLPSEKQWARAKEELAGAMEESSERLAAQLGVAKRKKRKAA